MFHQLFHKLAVVLTLGVLVTTAFLQTSARVSAAPDANKTFTLNSIADEPDELAGDGKCSSTPSHKCTLRAAVMEARALGGTITIILPPNNNYTLSRVGNDDSGLNGDLDVMGLVNLTLLGGDPYTTVIDGNQIDRLFDADAGASMTFKYLTLENGKTSFVGGAVHAGNAALTLDHVIVAHNQTTISGGGIYAGSKLTVLDSMVRDNTAAGNSAGGGITIGNYGGATALLVNTAVYNNTASADGGGLYIAGTAQLVNTTVAQNQAKGNGGGIYTHGTVTLANVTVAENSADTDDAYGGDGGGVFSDSGSTVTVRNSIFANNQDLTENTGLNLAPDCGGTFISDGYNLITIKDNCQGFTGGVKGDKTGSSFIPLDAGLDSLGISGVRGRYYLKSNSAARDAGTPTGCLDQNAKTLLFDTEYHARPINGCDMGATEYGTDCAPPLVPEIFVPMDGSKVKQTKVNLRWQRNIDCYGKFKLVVKQDSPKGKKVDGVKDLLAFQYTTKALPKGKSYYWQLVFCNPGGCAKSGWNQFHIK